MFKLPQIFYTSWILNLSSTISMALVAFVTPLVLGMFLYGNYVIESAIVLIIAGIFETIVVVTINDSHKSKTIVPITAVALLIMLGTFIVSLIFLFFFNSLIPILLYLGLVIRTSFTSINVRANLIKLDVMILVELFFLFSYSACLFIVYNIENATSDSLIIINALSQFIASIPLVILSYKNLEFDFGYRPKYKSISCLPFSRVYEDTFFLLMPFLSGLYRGSESAASIRVIGSTVKVAIKLCPLRYDTLLFHLKSFAPRDSIKINYRYIALGVILYITYFLFTSFSLSLFFPIKFPELYLLLSTPFILVGVILTPIVITKKPILITVANFIVALGLLLIFMFNLNYYIQLSLILYVAVSILILSTFYYKVFRV